MNGEKKRSDNETLRIYLLNVQLQFHLEAVLEGENRLAFNDHHLDSTRLARSNETNEKHALKPLAMLMLAFGEMKDIFQVSSRSDMPSWRGEEGQRYSFLIAVYLETIDQDLIDHRSQSVENRVVRQASSFHFDRMY